jgi:hypothetical protein
MMNNTPEGFYPIEAYTNGYVIVILGTPPELDDDDLLAHNCDAMGCGSVGPHVVASVPVLEPTPELRWGMLSQRHRYSGPLDIERIRE